MGNEERRDTIHISETDEYLAARILERKGKPLGIIVEKSDEDGHITLTVTNEDGTLEGHAVDFELSPSEHLILEERDLEQLLSTSLITSSALELFDFMLLRFSRFGCILEFTGNAWKLKILKPDGLKV